MITSNIRQILIVIAIVAALSIIGTIGYYINDYQYQKSEAVRQTENNRQLRISDSLRFTTQILSEREIKEYLQYNNSELKKNLERDGIRLNRIEGIVANTYKYRDDQTRSSDVSQLLAAIKQNKPTKVPFTDSAKCLTIKGFVRYENDSLKVDIVSRDFQNKNDGVVYWERREWKLLGIKTRLFGKKQFTAKQFDQCGETTTLKIEKKK